MPVAPHPIVTRATARTTAPILLALALVGISPRASAFDPSRLPDANIRLDFAKAFAVDLAQVVDARAFGLTGDPKRPGFILGRYRERPDSPWAFPGLVVYGPCKGGMCLHRVSLGEASKRLAPIAVVDLDATHTEVATLAPPHWNTRSVPQPQGRNRRPALILAAERHHERPARTDLVIVSLTTPEPAVLLDHPLERREDDVSEDDMRDPSGPHRPSWVPVGARLDGLAFDGTTHRLTLTERPIDSRWSGCLPSKSYPIAFALEGTRYREIPSNVPRPRSCE